MGAPLFGGGGVSEPPMVAGWLESTLGASAALSTAAPGGVHRGVADSSVAADAIFVVYDLQASPDAAGVAGWRIKTNTLWQIVAMGPASASVGVAIAAGLIDQLLQRAPTQTATTPLGAIRILECVRQSALLLDETTNGVQYVRIGGFYRIGARAA